MKTPAASLNRRPFKLRPALGGGTVDQRKRPTFGGRPRKQIRQILTPQDALPLFIFPSTMPTTPPDIAPRIVEPITSTTAGT